MSFGVSLAAVPQNGSAPLNVTATATVTVDAPFQGYVGLIVVDTTDHKHPSSLQYQAISVGAGSTDVSFLDALFLRFAGGVSGHTYSFTALLETVLGQIEATSQAVLVTVS